MKEIILDARCIGPFAHGFARYVSALVSGLMLLPERKYALTLIVRPGFVLPSTWQTPSSGKAEVRIWECPVELFSATELVAFPAWLRAQLGKESARPGDRIFHGPTFASYLSLPIPWMITIHDTNHLHYGDWRQKAYYHGLLKPYARRARRVMSVSAFAAEEVAHFLGLPRASVSLVPNAIGVSIPMVSTPAGVRRPETAVTALPSERFWFCMSNSKTHKNLKTIFEAYALYRLQVESPVSLYVTLDEAELSRLGAGHGVIGVGALDDAQAPAWYRKALGVLCPSEYEGFGLVPVEAAASGATLLVSDIPPHHEGLKAWERALGGDREGLRWLEPQSTRAWALCMEEIHRHPVAGASAAVQGAIREEFSVLRSGEAIDRVYQNVLGVGP